MSHVQLREASAYFLAHMCTEIVLFPHAITGGTDVWCGMGKHAEMMHVSLRSSKQKGM